MSLRRPVKDTHRSKKINPWNIIKANVGKVTTHDTRLYEQILIMIALNHSAARFKGDWANCFAYLFLTRNGNSQVTRSINRIMIKGELPSDIFYELFTKNVCMKVVDQTAILSTCRLNNVMKRSVLKPCYYLSTQNLASKTVPVKKAQPPGEVLH